MSVTETTPSLADLVSVYEAAVTHWEECRDRASEARSQQTDAQNEVNRAQKDLDAEFERLKKEAPGDSDWRRPTPRAVTAD